MAITQPRERRLTATIKQVRALYETALRWGVDDLAEQVSPWVPPDERKTPPSRRVSFPRCCLGGLS
jgi:hypothetical protein